MMPRIDDPILRARLIAHFRQQAAAWRSDEQHADTELTKHGCHVRAALAEQYARDLEDATLAVEA